MLDMNIQSKDVSVAVAKVLWTSCDHARALKQKFSGNAACIRTFIKAMTHHLGCGDLQLNGCRIIYRVCEYHHANPTILVLKCILPFPLLFLHLTMMNTTKLMRLTICCFDFSSFCQVAWFNWTTPPTELHADPNQMQVTSVLDVCQNREPKICHRKHDPFFSNMTGLVMGIDAPGL